MIFSSKKELLTPLLFDAFKLFVKANFLLGRYFLTTT